MWSTAIKYFTLAIVLIILSNCIIGTANSVVPKENALEDPFALVLITDLFIGLYSISAYWDQCEKKKGDNHVD